MASLWTRKAMRTTLTRFIKTEQSTSSVRMVLLLSAVVNRMWPPCLNTLRLGTKEELQELKEKQGSRLKSVQPNSIRTVRKDHKGHKDRKTYSFLLRLPLFETGSPLTSHLPLPRLAGRLANDQLSLKNGVPAFLG